MGSIPAECKPNHTEFSLGILGGNNLLCAVGPSKIDREKKLTDIFILFRKGFFIVNSTAATGIFETENQV